MKTTIKNLNINWLEIKNACRQTISMGDSKIEPNQEWKRKLLIARHSPLRLGTILLKLEDIPFYVMGHLVRHNVGVTPFVATSREDRTNKPRNERKQTDLVDMQLNANIEAMINISEKRLCTQADKTTRELWQQVKEEVEKYDEDVAWAMAPSGIYHCGCTEPFGDCRMCNKIIEEMPVEDRMDVSKRLDYYNEKVKVLKK